MAARARPSLTLAGAIGQVVIVHAVANLRTGIPPAYLRYLFRYSVQADVETAVGAEAGRRSLNDRSSFGMGPVPIAESAWDAVLGLLPARFPRPLAEPAVRLSPQRALHGVCRQAWLCKLQGVGIVLPR